MKHISDYRPAPGTLQNSTNSCESKSRKKNALPKSWVVALFKKFHLRYLHKWSTAIENIESEAVEEWAQQLAGLSGEDIKRGLERWDKTWPPSVAEFRTACVDAHDPHRENAAMYRDDRPRITDKAHLLSNDARDARRARNRAELQRAKEILKGNPKP